MKSTVYSQNRSSLFFSKNKNTSTIALNFISRIIGQNKIIVRRKVLKVIRVVRRRKRKMNQAERKVFFLNKESARAIILKRVEEIKNEYQTAHGIIFPPIGRISIKSLRTRWGSCSSKGNLNFSFKVAMLPDHLRDYIIAHELCHLIEFNHGLNFWQLVALYSPDFALHRHELKSYSPYGTIEGR